MTEKEIDDYKDELSFRRDELTMEEKKQMEAEFIRMVRLYKEEHPTHTKCVQRWRKWYIMIKDDLYNIPQKYMDKLQYHLETFRVADIETALEGLNNWLIKMNQKGYKINKKTIEKINQAIRPYGCEY